MVKYLLKKYQKEHTLEEFFEISVVCNKGMTHFGRLKWNLTQFLKIIFFDLSLALS